MAEQAQARPTRDARLTDAAAPSRNGTEPVSAGLRERLQLGTFTEARTLELLLALDDVGLVECLLPLVANPEHGVPLLYHTSILARLTAIRQSHVALYLGILLPGLRQLKIHVPDLERKLAALVPTTEVSLGPPETLTELLAADIPPPVQLFNGLMHEGMLLFGGKSKRGKSWLMFDLALSLAIGRSGFGHFGCPSPQPILYLALEDGRKRLQGRALAIQPNLQYADRFHLRYSFPSFAEGGIAILAQEIARYHYGLVVIDVLAKLEQPGIKGEKNYHEVYEMFAPLQSLRQTEPFCLAMLTHLRKQDAEDVFDALHGSVAYQGAQDVLWVLERKPKDDNAFLHIRDKDAEDTTLALHFTDGHWTYVGEGEEVEMSRDQRRIMRVLTEEQREMSIKEIMQAAGFRDEQYPRVRQHLMVLVKEDCIHRTKRGTYSATIRGSIEYGDFTDTDEHGDRVPF